jgi:hypothetical protein
MTEPKTRAERTDYTETSSYADVLEFLEVLKTTSKRPLKVETLAVSTEGRSIPLAVLGTPGPGKLTVYIQANIHAGEVEGKEAALMLLRDLPTKLLDRLFLVVAPIYNADGNEKWGDGRKNRAHQDGPARVGVRTNGQGLDLNRDCIKAESPEMRGVLKNVYARYDPDVVFDLHTTNGTRHGWSLTYAPPTHPSTPEGVLRYCRDLLLPEVRKTLKKQRGWELFDYGNTERRTTDPASEQIWATFGEEGRYVTNYAGLRGSLAILSEAVSFLPFKFRVESTYVFVFAILEVLARDSQKIQRLRESYKLPEELGIRFSMSSRGIEAIPLEKPRPESEIDHTKAPTVLETVKIPVFDRWTPTRTARVPRFYGIPGNLFPVVALLRRHGIVLQPVRSAWQGKAEVFQVQDRAQGLVFQGHRLNQLKGTWASSDATLPPGSFLAPTNQPLGRLLFHLLEPECLDGVAAWNFLDDALKVGQPYPILKLLP